MLEVVGSRVGRKAPFDDPKLCVRGKMEENGVDAVNAVLVNCLVWGGIEGAVGLIRLGL